jgi:hypothetical protein
MSDRVSEISRFKAEFHRLIDAGSGNMHTSEGSPLRWDAVSFDRAVAAAARRHGAGAASPTLRTIRNWLDRKKDELPRERFIEPILDVLFSKSPSGRRDFRALWEAARQARRASGADGNILDAEPGPPSVDGWEVAETENIGRGLASLNVHRPPKTNAEDNSFPLHLSLYLAQLSDEIEGISVLLGLRAAHLTLDHVNCQPRPIDDEPEFIRESGGVYAVTGPFVGDHLQGRPLANSKLVTMERTRDGAASVTVSLRSRHRDLEVIFDDPDRDVSATREKIMQVFLQECHVSESERQIVWSRATLTEKDGL